MNYSITSYLQTQYSTFECTFVHSTVLKYYVFNNKKSEKDLDRGVFRKGGFRSGLYPMSHTLLQEPHLFCVKYGKGGSDDNQVECILQREYENYDVSVQYVIVGKKRPNLTDRVDSSLFDIVLLGLGSYSKFFTKMDPLLCPGVTYVYDSIEFTLTQVKRPRSPFLLTEQDIQQIILDYNKDLFQV